MSEDRPRGNDWTEVANAVIIATAGLMISWASYQAALWDGEQAAAYSRSNALYTESAQVAASADARREIEVELFAAWLNAAARDEPLLANFYASRFPPDLRDAFNVWSKLRPLKNPSAPPSPFSTPGYRPAGPIQSRALADRAKLTYEQGQKANDVSDAFGQAETMLSTALFFAGIGQVFKMRRVRAVLLSVAAASCLLGLVRVFTLPMLFLLGGRH